EVEALGVLAVGHLQPAQHLALDAHQLDRAAAQLDVDRLPADDVGGAGHDVGGGDAPSDGHADAGVVGVEGVQRAQRRLHRAAALVAVLVGGDVRPGPDADVRVGVDQAGDDGLAGDVDHLGPGGDGRVGPADGEDLALVDQEDALVDGGAGGGVEAGAS